MAKKRGRAWWVLLGLLLAGLGLGQPTPASAHALLIRSVPEANAQLRQPPATIEMWFSEPLEAGFSRARLFSATGQEVPTGPTTINPADATHMVLTLGQLKPGVYTVAWQTLSQADGHEFYGSFPLTILNPDGSRPTAAAPTGAEEAERGELPGPGEIIARWLALLGGILFFGAPLFYTVVANAGAETTVEAAISPATLTRPLVLKALWVAAFMIILGSWLQIILLTFRLGDLSGLPNLLLGTRTGVLGLIRQTFVLTGLMLALWRLDPAQFTRKQEPPFWLEAAVYHFVIVVFLIGAALKAQWLLALSAIVISLAGLIPLLRQPGQLTVRKVPVHLWLLCLAAILLLSFSIGSHASAAPGWIWAVLGDYLHLLAAAAWLGGLLLLPVLTRQMLRSDSAWLWPLVQRFSRLAVLSVFVLSLTGLFNSLVQLPNLTSLLATAYGWILLLKLGLMGLVLAVAFLNHRLVHPGTRSGAELTAWPRFQRQVTLEAVFSLGLMLSVAVLVQTPTPASFAADATASSSSGVSDYITQADDLTIHTQILPNQVGQNLFLVHLYHADNSPIGEVQLVRLRFNYQEAQLGQAQVDLEPRGGDIFGVEGAFLSQAGQWNLSIYIRRRGLDDSLAEVSLAVPASTGQIPNTSPWQNPVPSLPVGLAIAGALVGVGVITVLWRQSRSSDLPKTHPE